MEKLDKSGFTVPENYFEGLADVIQARLSAERLKEAVTESGHVVPEGYFDSLGPRIMAKIAAEGQPLKKETKILRLWHSNILKYASAACFVLVSTFGFYFYQHEEIESKQVAINLSSENDQSLYDLDEQEIIDHIETDKTVETTTSATNTEIENYILSNYSQSDITKNL